jgi:hypothetical protein
LETLAFLSGLLNERSTDDDCDSLPQKGSAPAYIARRDEPQPSDQTDLKQWSRYVVEVGWRPSRET